MQRVDPNHPSKKDFPAPYFYSGFQRKVCQTNSENDELSLLSGYYVPGTVLKHCADYLNCINLFLLFRELEMGKDPPRRKLKAGFEPQVLQTPRSHELTCFSKCRAEWVSPVYRKVIHPNHWHRKVLAIYVWFIAFHCPFPQISLIWLQ